MSSSTYANELCFLEAAIKKDDLQSFSNRLSLNPILFKPSKWEQNPLAVACLYGSRRVAEKIARDYPESLKLKDKNGQTPLHIASSKGDLPLVELFINLDSQICRIKDKCSLIPLHLAVQHGFADVITALVGACPRSIEAVSRHCETVFHLAAKHYQSHAFEVLLQLALQLNKHRLLHRKDRQGDNVLHIAASHKLTGVVAKLLPEQNSKGQALVRVNTMNRNGLTALDVYYQTNRDVAATEDIGHILREAGGLEARSLTATDHIRETLETKNVILVVLSVITGAAFATACNPPASFLVKNVSQEFGAPDVMSAKLPSIFYLMVFNTVVFMVCLVVILVLLWSLPLLPALVLLTLAYAIVYCILLDNNMPKLFVRVGSFNIPGVALLGLLSLGFVSVAAILYNCFLYGCQIVKWVISKKHKEIQHLK